MAGNKPSIIRERHKISKKAIDEALKNPETKAVIERGLKARGASLQDLLDKGFIDISWEKNYTEHHHTELEDKGNPVIKSDIGLNNAELSALTDLVKKSAASGK